MGKGSYRSNVLKSKLKGRELEEMVKKAKPRRLSQSFPAHASNRSSWLNLRASQNRRSVSWNFEADDRLDYMFLTPFYSNIMARDWPNIIVPGTDGRATIVFESANLWAQSDIEHELKKISELGPHHGWFSFIKRIARPFKARRQSKWMSLLKTHMLFSWLLALCSRWS